MNYKKLLEKLEQDTTIVELEMYLSGQRRFDYRTCTPEQKQKLITIIIPKLIKNIKKENEKLSKLWIKSPLLRLAFTRCKQKKIKLYEIKKDDTEITKKYKHTSNFYNTTKKMIEIINQMNKDTQSELIRQRFSEYSKHVEAGDYGTDDI